ncbi:MULTISPECIES: LON peptidase substrate-binding domain-containing protein [Shewanella]|uniref:LON peptidase substrate-binding domain-containing protein n=2 Tax=Shewanella TaxID=22 RepID=A0A974XUN3_9GAMM|nr:MULTISPECIES: LON peptidase substrate-binding domain-containing protein [Shewanella]QSX30609.1 LON peptidase substrate-binding domain-containing protein [Shewanella cyperi]QSX37830.1 LON peptidase substrate-binding domain-containing protein [Shewanella sedimentimangrovi]QSX41387.1 LON peptidase substrate-binding domain-containing protein [Shewanella cyperi]
MQTQEMALLTHDALLLPDGRLELRIIEPRYLRMVADVFKGRYPLAFGMLKPNGHPPCYPEATQCKIIDFNQLEDDSLSIVLEGEQRVRIISAAQERDGLWKVRAVPCQNWAHEPILGEFTIISAALEQFYQVNPDLLHLYHDMHLEDAAWVSQRWLEVLPMYNQDKFKLVSQPDCHKTMDFVLRLIKSHAG